MEAVAFDPTKTAWFAKNFFEMADPPATRDGASAIDRVGADGRHG
jgi:hypothetical protein